MSIEALWQALGGRGELPSRAGKCSGPLLIMGSGRVAVGGEKLYETVWDDFAKVRPWKGEIMCVNDVGMHIQKERVRHWVSLHPEYFPGWMTFRKGHLYGSGDTPMTHSHKGKPGVDVVWNMPAGVAGTSGLFACFVGLLLGYNEILLAGIPMTGSGHYFDPPWNGSEFQDTANEITWKQARDTFFAGRVKSLSGKTKEWLGAPQLKAQEVEVAY